MTDTIHRYPDNRLGFRDPARKSAALERQVEARICDYAKMLGILTYKFVSPAHRGVPDRIFVFPGGQVAFMEVKRNGEEPTSLQKSEMGKLSAQGALVAWFDDAEKACRWLNTLLNSRKA
jgi:hypothetical protein